MEDPFLLAEEDDAWLGDEDDSDYAPAKTKSRYGFSRITSHLAQMILNVRDFFVEEARAGRSETLYRPRQRTAAATGLSIKTISRVARNGIQFYPDPDTPHVRERASKVPEEFRGYIRMQIFELYGQRQLITVSGLLDFIQTNWSGDREFLWGRTTLYKLMREAGLTYGDRKNHYDYAKEKLSIVNQRTAYIKKVQAYRDNHYSIWYQDETWFCKNMTEPKVWRDAHGNGGFEVPSGKGERIIFAHVGSDKCGFLPGAMLSFLGRKSTLSDYHGEFNADIFQQWMDEEVFPRLPLFSVMVLDRAPYHMVLTDETRPVRSAMNKAEICEWLKAHGDPTTIEANMRMLKKDLYAKAKAMTPAPKTKIEEIGEQYGVKVIFLPVAHPELNPIELQWANMKRYVRHNNKDFTTMSVIKLIREREQQITRENWIASSKECVKWENIYFKTTSPKPLNFTTTVERLICSSMKSVNMKEKSKKMLIISNNRMIESQVDMTHCTRQQLNLTRVV